MVCKIQWKLFWLATQLCPQNDWTGWQFRVNSDVFAQAQFNGSLFWVLTQLYPQNAWTAGVAILVSWDVCVLVPLCVMVRSLA